MQEKELDELLDRYASGHATAADLAFLESWYNQLQQGVPDDYLLEERLQDARAVWEKLQPVNERPKIQSLWPRIFAAASVLAFLSFGYLLLHRQHVPEQTDIAPGGNKAVLSFNGQKIRLENARNGTVASNSMTTVIKQSGGKLIYVGAGQGSYDTLTTPRGGTYQLTLSDGSRIWLNAATAIRYHRSFSGDKFRTVELLYGEAYYEVKHDIKQPFHVIVGKQTIEDIGTHFDVNAYADEGAVKTTLLEGGIKVVRGNQFRRLVPGQQSLVLTGGNSIQVRDADTEEAMAWKNGYFQFTNADIKAVMRQLARWYDVQVVYQGPVSTHLFTGDIHRDITAAQAMQILTYLQISYRIEGKKIIINSQTTN